MFEWYNKLLLKNILKWQFIVLLKPYTGCVKEFYCMIYTIKLCNKTIHNIRSKKENVCVQTIYCIKDTMYCFLMTYLLLDTINFTRSGICLSEVWARAWFPGWDKLFIYGRIMCSMAAVWQMYGYQDYPAPKPPHQKAEYDQ